MKQETGEEGEREKERKEERGEGRREKEHSLHHYGAWWKPEVGGGREREGEETAKVFGGWRGCNAAVEAVKS